MRISCDPTDQGYSPTARGYCATLDGKPVINFITADEELGTVHIIERTANEGCDVTVLSGVVRLERVH